MNTQVPEVTQLLEAYREGDAGAWNNLVRILYGDLRRLARSKIGGRASDHTLNTTSLVHECYLRLLGPAQANVESRMQFFALASMIMRQVICDYAREQLARKRGGDQQRMPLEQVDEEAFHEASQLVELDELLRKLEVANTRAARVFECRYFAGLTDQECADALDLSLRTVQREWQFARAWLNKQLDSS